MPILPTIAVLLAALLAPLPQVGPKRPPPELPREDDPAFETLQRAYDAARISYDQQRVDAERGLAERPTSHPARTHWPRFAALAEQGSARARGWLCANAAHSSDDPAARIATLRAQFDALAQCCAASTSLLDALGGVQALAQDLGADAAAALAERIAGVSTQPEIQARAVLQQARLLLGRPADRGGAAPDPARLEQARELQRMVVSAWPRTSAGREAAGILLPEAERAFLEAQKAWIGRARELQAAGRDPSEWPKQPIHEARLAFLPLAETQHETAQRWCENFYPAYEQSERLGPGHSIAWLVRELGQRYGPRHAGWAAPRAQLLALVLRQFPDAPWQLTSLRDYAPAVPQMPPLVALDVARAVLDGSKEPEARALALSIEAETRRAEGGEIEMARAAEAYERLAAEHPGVEPLATRAREGAAALRRALPGQPLPESRGEGWTLRDGENQELAFSGYRGKVLMLDVFDGDSPEYCAVLPERRALREKLQGRPFEMVGLCTTPLALRTWSDIARRLGIAWRTGLLQSERHPLLLELQIRRKVSAILVDARGVIRARDLPWDEMVQRAEALVAEAEAPPSEPRR